jgi:hypothetical protein
MERDPTTLYLWISRFAGLAGIVCVIMAVVTAVTEEVLMALPQTYIQIAIAAFLVAIWAILYEIRDRGIKSR